MSRERIRSDEAGYCDDWWQCWALDVNDVGWSLWNVVGATGAA